MTATKSLHRKPSLLLGLLFVLLIGSLCGWPRHCLADAPAPIERLTLPDGVRLLLKPEPITDVTAITVFIQTPRALSSQEIAISDMVAHALFYGSTDRTRDGIALSVAQVGGVLETLRTPDYVALTIVTIPEQIEETARLLGEALKHADFTPEALDRASRDILANRKQSRENGYDAGADRIRAVLNAREDPTDDQLRLITQQQAQAYFVRNYVPAHTVVSVVGRFVPKDVTTAFLAYFASYDRPTPTLTVHRPPELSVKATNTNTSTLAMPTISMTISNGTAGYALIGTQAPNIVSPDAPAFTVLQALLGGGHASRLFRRVRDTLGIGYGVSAIYRTDLADPLIAYLQWDTRRADAGGTGTALPPAEALQRIAAQLDGVLTDPPDDVEVERARNVAIGRDALRHERARDRAFLLGWYETVGLGYSYDIDYPRLLSAVTRADVLRVAAKYLPVRATVTVVPEK